MCVNRRPAAVQDRQLDSDDDDFSNRDYDISTMANNINREVYHYGMFDNDDAEEVCLIAVYFNFFECSKVLCTFFHLFVQLLLLFPVLVVLEVFSKSTYSFLLAPYFSTLASQYAGSRGNG